MRPITDWVRKHPFATGILLGGVAMVAVFITLATVLHDISGTASAACHAVNTVNAEITRYLGAQAAHIGQKGTAGYNYYKDHPADLKLARESLDQTLSVFRPVSC